MPLLLIDAAAVPTFSGKTEADDKQDEWVKELEKTTAKTIKKLESEHKKKKKTLTEQYDV